MIKSVLFWCVSSLFVSLYGKTVPFIDPCRWDDRECMRISAQKAIPYVAEGVPSLRISSLDPLSVNKISVNEGELNIEFTDTKIYRLKECQMMEVERNIQEHWLRILLECPIEIRGNYVSSGKILFVPIEGNGPFVIQSDKVSIAGRMDLNTVDNHWKLSNVEHTFDFKEKAVMKFENLFGGDEEKAAPVLNIMDNQWKEIVQSVGKPIVADAVQTVFAELVKITDQVPANELEL